MSGSMPCIWMSAGLVAYKLCDREYECESCPFDAAMRGAEAERVADAVRPAPAPEPSFPADRRYTPGHLWVRGVGRDRVRIGIDGFAAELLADIDTVILPPPGTPVRRDASLCWVHDDGNVVSLHAPLTGKVSVTHGLVRHRPGTLTEDPYGNGWLFEVRVRDGRTVGQGTSLLTAASIRELARRQRQDLEREVRSFASDAAVGVGPTLQDGGVPLAGPRAVLGPDRYYRIISAFLV